MHAYIQHTYRNKYIHTYIQIYIYTYTFQRLPVNHASRRKDRVTSFHRPLPLLRFIFGVNVGVEGVQGLVHRSLAPDNSTRRNRQPLHVTVTADRMRIGLRKLG